MNELKVAIVTGAGSGIGRAAVVALTESGYAVALAGRDRKKLEETAALLDSRSTIVILSTDVTDPAACTSLVETTVKKLGRLDALCNVAGFVDRLQPLHETDAAAWRHIVDVNVSGPLYLTRAAWPHLTARTGGVIVNVSSMASIDPFDGLGAYAMAKSAVNMMTHVTAREGQGFGLTAVAIAPGAVETPMLRGLSAAAALPADEALDPAEVGGLIADCVTGKRLFAPGELIVIQR